MRKKFLMFVLTVSLMLAMTPETLMAAKMEEKSMPVREAEQKTPSEEKEAAAGGVSDMKGDGTKEAPYRIGNAEQFCAFADLVNGADGVPATGICASLTDNISLSGICGAEIGSWTPIGTVEHPYTGTFDGGSFTITGLYFHEPDASYTGLFGYNAGTIKNVGVVGADITAGNYTGGVCGYNSGIISGCRHAATTRGVNYTGGICGYNAEGGIVNVCYNTGAVSGRKYVGGVCGYNKNNVVDCYNQGPVNGDSTSIGGVCGYNKALLSNCFNTGTVNGGGRKYVGSVCGYNYSKSTFLNCYYLITGEEKGNYGVAMSEAQFASGEVCWLLNGEKSENVVWHQTCGVGFPTFAGKTVYRVQRQKEGGRADEIIVAYINEKEQKQAADVSAQANASDQDSGDAEHRHNYRDPEWKWTEYESAKAVFTCQDCGEKVTLAAKISERITPATCAAEGKTVYTASVNKDGKNYTNQKIIKSEKLPHQTPLTQVMRKDETCEENGIKDCWTCDACGKYFADAQGATELSKSQVVIPAKGHHYVRNGDWIWNIDSDPDSNPVRASLCFICDNSGCGETEIQEAKVTADTTATCTKEGDTVYTATLRFHNETYTGEKKVPGKKLPHSYGEPKWTWAKDYKSAVATFTCSSCKQALSETTNNIDETKTSGSDCKTPGKITYTASVLFKGTTYTDQKTEATAPEHKLTLHAGAKAATCISEGNKEYWQCSVCRKYFSDAQGAKEVPKNQVMIPALGHLYTDPKWEWHLDHNPVTASATFHCDRGCGETETIEAKVTSKTSATCTTAGETTYTAVAKMDDRSYTDERKISGQPIPHSYGEPKWTWAADKRSATATFTCGRCNHTETVSDTSPISERTEEPTCLKAGKVAYTARVTFEGEEYTDVKTETIPKTEHSYSGQPKWTWEKDYSKATAAFICDICKQSIQKDASIEEKKTLGSDCKTPGTITYTASVVFNGTAFTDTKTEEIAPAHKLTHIAAKEATCTREGNEEYWQCSTCGNLFGDAEGNEEITTIPTIPELEHDFEKVTKDVYRCRLCKKSFTITEQPDGTKSISSVEDAEVILQETPLQFGLEEEREDKATSPAEEQDADVTQTVDGQTGEDEQDKQSGQEEQAGEDEQDKQSGQEEQTGEDIRNESDENRDGIMEAPEDAARYGLVYPENETEEADAASADAWEENVVNLRAKSQGNAAAQTVQEQQSSSLWGSTALLLALGGFILILLYKGKKVM